MGIFYDVKWRSPCRDVLFREIWLCVVKTNFFLSFRATTYNVPKEIETNELPSSAIHQSCFPRQTIWLHQGSTIGPFTIAYYVMIISCRTFIGHRRPENNRPEAGTKPRRRGPWNILIDSRGRRAKAVTKRLQLRGTICKDVEVVWNTTSSSSSKREN
jgi:hypothetical protein